MGTRASIALLFLAAGCGGRPSTEPARPRAPNYVSASNEFRRLELPGFWVDVPTGLGVGDGRVADYREGKFRLEGYDRRFAVTWSTLPLMSPDDLSVLQLVPSDGSLAVEGARSFKLGSLDAVRTQAVVDSEPIELVAIGCGHRTVTIAFNDHEPAPWRDHVVTSFDCHPIAGEEAALSNEVPIGVDDPKLLTDWYQIEDDTAFAFAITNDQLFISIHVAPFRDVNFESGFAATNTVRAMMTAVHWTSTRLEKRRARDGRERQFQLGTMQFDDMVLDAAVTAWSCGDRTLVVMSNAAPGAHLADVIDVIMKLRCAQPGDPPLFRR